ncbi:hypothetical protein D5086_003408 [Populus alba]|uniref:Uncharacterized protein n=1 Tax=Populus alba TaxID=43335 RepID=A0ACC4D4R6_POPAL
MESAVGNSCAMHCVVIKGTNSQRKIELLIWEAKLLCHTCYNGGHHQKVQIPFSSTNYTELAIVYYYLGLTAVSSIHALSYEA